MNQVKACPVCGSLATTTFLRRQQVPVHQNLLLADAPAASAVARGDLDLKYCAACGFIFNSTFDLAKLNYDASYDNTQTCSPFFAAHVDELVRHLVQDKGVRDCRIVEVGCGQGLFLRKLIEPVAAGNTGYGFDPAYRGPETDLHERLRFQRSYYGPECADIEADVVVCRHVIEHVPEPVSLLRTIRQALIHSPTARVFFETPCVEWVLRHQVIWDFFYEHCSYWTQHSLTTAFARAGFQVESVQHVFGGQYLWLEASVAPTPAGISSSEVQQLEVPQESGAIPELAAQFSRAERELPVTWLQRITVAAARGAVALWGAGAKGVTLANLIDPQGQVLACVVDLNPQKQGHYLPGTGHPIIAPHQLADYDVKTVILMNPNYHDEIQSFLRSRQTKIELVILDAGTA